MNMKNFPKRLDSKTSYLRITVPENLDLALEGLIRKVLKEQPKTDDIYSFAADYFETLMKIRDKAGAKFIADQLCPFHNDEDAHEMIKLAGTFSKPGTKELRKKNEEFVLLKTKNAAKNKNSDKQIHDKKYVKKPKSEKISKDEKAVEQNKQVTSKIIKKLPVTVKNISEEEDKQIKSANVTSDDINSEKNIKTEESDDEEFLASDPIKELVEKELMETKLSGKKEEIEENTTAGMNTPMSPDDLTTNKNIQKQQPVDNKNVQPAINDANEPLAEENAASKVNFIEKYEEDKSTNKEIEETKITKEKEIKIEDNKIIQQASKKSASDIVEENKGKTANAEEESDKVPKDVEEENKESANHTEKSDKENTKGTTEIDQKSATNLENVNNEKTKDFEKRNRSTEITEEEKIIIDKTSDLETSEPEGQPLPQEIQSEEEINKRLIEMTKETAEKSSENLKTATENDTNKTICNEILAGDSTIDIDHNVKEQEEKNVKTSEEFPSNEIKPEEKESKEPLKDQKTTRVNGQIDAERETKLQTETAAKDENVKSTTEHKTVETSVINIKPPLTEPDAKHDVKKVENSNNQELKAQEQRMTDNETGRTTKTEATNVISPKDRETTEGLKKTEEVNKKNNATQVEQPFKITEQIKEIQADEPKNKEHMLKNHEKPLEIEETAEDNKNENTIQNAKENGAEVLESITNEQKLIPKETIDTNENKAGSESTMLQTNSKNNLLKGKPELSSTNKDSCQSEDKISETFSPKLPPDPTNSNEVIKSEKKEKLSNETRIKATEDTLFGEKTHDLERNIDNKNLQTPDDQNKKISKIQEDQQGVNENIAESESTNKEFVAEEEENVRKTEDEVFTSSDIFSATKPDKEKSNEVLKFATPDNDETQNSETESEKETRKEEFDSQRLYFKSEDKNDQISEGKTEGDLRTETDIHQISKEDETSSEKPNEKSKSKDKFHFRTSSENGGDDSKPEEELCTVLDVQQIPKGDAIDGNLEEKYKFENTQNKEDKTKMEESPHVITVEEADKTEENQETPQSSKEIQIKTIQSHYYNTLQVPETVTKEYRVRNISSPPISALLNVANSLQQSFEPKHKLLNKEERTEKIVDVDSTPLVEKKMPETARATQSIKSDDLQFVNHLKNLDTPANASNQNELEVDTQKSDSDELLDLLTPTSGYSLNLSELSWQTVNELFLDNEKRNSSLEKEEIKYVTPKASKTTGESADSRQEIEEIIHKTVVHSGIDAVPVPPRDLEANTQISENTEEKKEEDKPEGESTESSDSSNEQISVNDDTPFISVEVKTVIETQILDDDDDDEHDHIRNEEQNGEEKIRPDMEIKVKTTVDFGNEMGMTQSESEPKENKMEATDETRKNDLISRLEIQDKSRRVRSKESSSTEQTTGVECSSGESDSTISSAATEIKRADFAKRNFSSTRSLLSTQSLDLEKKNPLSKTRSLSTFRHGVTDFEVWSTIEKELEEAATKIQSKFRGYKTRKKLQRENAVQITTEESSSSVTPVEAEIKNECQQSTGEFHDSIVLADHPR